jgi:predicted phosphodiesterase
MRAREFVVGVISDTHGLLRPEALDALRGSDMIIHAGDVGKPEVIDRLGEVAPTHVVRGNVDKGSWAAALPMTELVELGEHRFFVLHDISQLDVDPVAAGFAAVVFGLPIGPRSKRGAASCFSIRGVPVRAASSCRSRSRA